MLSRGQIVQRGPFLPVRSRDRRRSAARLVAGVAAGLTLALVTACGGDPGKASWHIPGAKEAGSVHKGIAVLSVTPSGGATNVSPAEPVVVTASDATIDSVAITNSAGKPVAGALDAGKTTWRSTEPLGYDRSYTVTAKATGAAGNSLEQVVTFTTVRPRNVTMPYLRSSNGHLLNENGTYGVGQPVILWFDEPIRGDRDAVLKNVKVDTTPPVEGKWHWFNEQEAHWRPKDYWTAGTKVSVKASVYGKDLGGGLYGEADAAASFSIGQSKIAIADYNTKRLLVYVDGQLVRDVPVSLGKGGYYTGSKGEPIHFWTYGGTMVVLEKTPTTHMKSASFGITDKNDPQYYDEIIKLTVKLSYDGIYAHMADWNIGAHGNANTSHGCVNIGPANAQWFYDLFGPGDIVDVRNSPVEMKRGEGIIDWHIPWDQW